MARTIAQLPKGTRITDYISLGVLTKTFSLDRVKGVLISQGKTSRRQRELPAHVVVYYVICLALFMQVSYREVLRCLLEGLTWLLGPRQALAATGKSGISQARTRLGWQVMRQLHEEVVKPVAVEATKGAWYRQWRLASLDGSTLEVADEKENERAFGRPSASRGSSAYPQIRFVSLVENGTHVFFGTRMADYATGEITLAHDVIASLQKGMLCLADRNFFGFGLWNRARATGADLLWRVVTRHDLFRCFSHAIFRPISQVPRLCTVPFPFVGFWWDRILGCVGKPCILSRSDEKKWWAGVQVPGLYLDGGVLRFAARMAFEGQAAFCV
jgi:hypothetical protein